MDPQQELFTELRTRLLRLYPGHVYDGALPDASTPYPFIYLGESTTDDDENKSAVFGEVTQSVHVWMADVKKRGTLSSMMLDVKKAARAINRTKNFQWQVSGVHQTILPDKTTKTPLLHGVVEMTFSFS